MISPQGGHLKLKEVPKADHIPNGYKKSWRSTFRFFTERCNLTAKQARKWADTRTRLEIKLDSKPISGRQQSGAS